MCRILLLLCRYCSGRRLGVSSLRLLITNFPTLYSSRFFVRWIFYKLKLLISPSTFFAARTNTTGLNESFWDKRETQQRCLQKLCPLPIVLGDLYMKISQSRYATFGIRIILIGIFYLKKKEDFSINNLFIQVYNNIFKKKKVYKNMISISIS